MPTTSELRDAAPAPRPARAPPRVQLGLVVSPAIDMETAVELSDALGRALGERYPEVGWDLDVARDRLLRPPANLTELVDAVRSRLLAEDWDLALHVTDLPLRLSRRPLLSHVSPTHGVALVSLPALGVWQRERRLRQVLTDVVGVFTGPRTQGRHRLSELATDVDDDPDREGVLLLARVITGNIRLLLGMIRANRPARLVPHLSRALVGALAAASFGLVTSDIWRIANSLDPFRLGGLTLASLALAIVTLIAAHGMWERAEQPQVREQVLLFNAATVATLGLGVLALYVAVFAVGLGAAGLLIDPALFADATADSASVTDYLSLAWLVSSLATVGGALGGALESDAAVREAAYAYQPDAVE